jgi:hypothetical protein
MRKRRRPYLVGAAVVVVAIGLVSLVVVGEIGRPSALATSPASQVLAPSCSGCGQHAPGSPEAIVEGALRSNLEALVAPPAYRSGLLTPELADSWVARAESEYRAWYASPTIDRMITGIHNVTGALMAQPGPIETSVDITMVDVPSATVDGDEATVDYATMSAVKHFAPEAGADADVVYGAMLSCKLHLTENGWRVTDASWTDSGA